FLTPHPTSHLRCQKCLADLIPTSSIISKGFTGRHGRAYLVSPPPLSTFMAGGNGAETACCAQGDIPNTVTHEARPRQLVTGAHTVSDISCRRCESVLGWKYVDAAEDAQKYKVGKFILETKRIVKGAEWDAGVGELETRMEGDEGDGEFDSQDEEECEDLFSAIWTPQLARRRRKERAFDR
ncbi:yippee-domain-containing protein, partial [Decorospora gaudefroyi]